MGYKSYPTMAKKEVEIKVAVEKRAQVGDKVQVYPGIGLPPIEGVVQEIDTITGLIITVLVKDSNKKEKLINVKNLLVILAPTIINGFKLLWRKIKRMF